MSVYDKLLADMKDAMKARAINSTRLEAFPNFTSPSDGVLKVCFFLIITCA